MPKLMIIGRASEPQRPDDKARRIFILRGTKLVLNQVGTRPIQKIGTSQSYRADIDGLRALAVMAVMAFHFFPGSLSGGFVGVDIFFVISGYLISGHIFRDLYQGQFTLAGFYGRRVRRIFPALITIMVGCFAFGWLALFANEFALLGKHIAAGATFVANFVFWSEVGYFDESSLVKPLLHLWSLGVEEQFYIAWPILAWAAWKIRFGAIGVIITIGLLSFILNLTVITYDPSAAFYSPYTRVWELLIGAALAETERLKSTLPSPILNTAASGLGALLVAVGFWQIREGDAFPGLLAALPAFGAALLIAAGPTAPINRYILTFKPMVLVGLISYPLYLWHWPLLSFSRIVESATPDRTIRLILVIATFVLATLTYLLIERPIRFGAWRKNPKVTAGLCAAMAFVGGLGFYAYASGGVPMREAALSSDKISSQVVGSMWAFTSNDKCLSRFKMPGAEDYGWWFCMLKEDRPPTILVTGGSFANQLYPGLANNPHLAGENILSIGTCAPLHVDPGSMNGPLTYKPCSGARWADQNVFIEKILRENPSIRTVIIGGLSTGNDAKYISDAVTRIRELSVTNAQIVVFEPHLGREFDIRGCFARPFAKPQISCDFSIGEYQDHETESAELERQLRAKVPKILYFKQNQIFCREGRCSLVADGYPLIRDTYRHLSEHASMLVGEAFVRWAQTYFPSILDTKRL